jgi:hypothetical protein
VQGGAQVAKRLVAHEGIDAIFFTGSTAVGKAILATTAAEPGKLVVLELGGKNAAIVLDDADVERAAREIAFSAYVTAGQRCTATARVYAQRGVTDALVEKLRAAAERAIVEQVQKQNADNPVNITPDRIDPQLLGIASYVKPSVGLQLLRQEIMGPDAFDDAFRAYIRRWAFKHPTPGDFFRTMEDVGGRRLDWFWREWFPENEHFDQTVEQARAEVRGDTTNLTVVYANRARGVLPIRARFTFSDGTTQDFAYPAEVWSTNTVRYARRYSFVGKTVTQIELDPEHRLVDIDRDNNIWKAATTQ